MDVEAGPPFEIQLASAPSTGYRWEVASLPDGLEVLETDFEIAPDAAIGDPGTQRFRLRATRPGHYAVGFVLRRPWESEGLEARTVDVDARPPSD